MKDGNNADKRDGGVGCWVGAGLLGGGRGCWVGVWGAGWECGQLGGNVGCWALLEH